MSRPRCCRFPPGSAQAPGSADPRPTAADSPARSAPADPFTVTAMLAAVAVLPKLSVVASVIVSDPVVLSDILQRRQTGIHLRQRSRHRQALGAGARDMPVPMADSRPLLSASVTVNVSPLLVLPVSDTLTPGNRQRLADPGNRRGRRRRHRHPVDRHRPRSWPPPRCRSCPWSHSA